MRYERESDRKKQKLILLFLQNVGEFAFFKETSQEEQHHFDASTYIDNIPTWLEAKWFNCRSDKHLRAIIPVSKYDYAQKLEPPVRAWYAVKYEDKVVVWDLKNLTTHGKIDKPRKDREEVDPVYLISISDAIYSFPIEIF